MVVFLIAGLLVVVGTIFFIFLPRILRDGALKYFLAIECLLCNGAFVFRYFGGHLQYCTHVGYLFLWFMFHDSDLSMKICLCALRVSTFQPG